MIPEPYRQNLNNRAAERSHEQPQALTGLGSRPKTPPEIERMVREAREGEERLAALRAFYGIVKRPFETNQQPKEGLVGRIDPIRCIMGRCACGVTRTPFSMIQHFDDGRCLSGLTLVEAYQLNKFGNKGVGEGGLIMRELAERWICDYFENSPKRPEEVDELYPQLLERRAALARGDYVFEYETEEESDAELSDDDSAELGGDDSSMDTSE
ncbi:hypothetical protein F5Y04DRAFT_284149 [Hypomontagnella monticulosa]|nr:hypothetical protein F5Y04DRAFT_284149 [Hypomontagnella monticulosa]